MPATFCGRRVQCSHHAPRDGSTIGGVVLITRSVMTTLQNENYTARHFRLEHPAGQGLHVKQVGIFPTPATSALTIAPVLVNVNRTNARFFARRAICLRN